MNDPNQEQPLVYQGELEPDEIRPYRVHAHELKSVKEGHLVEKTYPLALCLLGAGLGSVLSLVRDFLRDTPLWDWLCPGDLICGGVTIALLSAAGVLLVLRKVAPNESTIAYQKILDRAPLKRVGTQISDSGAPEPMRTIDELQRDFEQ